jgi:Cdc6-like AAA superfamily ATPase
MDIQQFVPNDEQQDCLKLLNGFITANKPHSKLLINGSAGTGKTTIIIKTIIEIIITKALPSLKSIAVLNEKEYEQLMFTFPSFIISAPTNKAKDVLLHKYNNFISSLDLKECNNHKSLLLKILSNRIEFLTVSQVLSIKRQINELGEEEFTKGNDKKIASKYSKPTYDNTFIIVDECSMIETNSTKLLNLIKCPIIYILLNVNKNLVISSIILSKNQRILFYLNVVCFIRI